MKHNKFRKFGIDYIVLEGYMPSGERVLLVELREMRRGGKSAWYIVSGYAMPETDKEFDSMFDHPERWQNGDDLYYDIIRRVVDNV